MGQRLEQRLGAWGCGHHRRLQEARKESTQSQGEPSPADTLTLDFWPLEH